MPKSTRIKHYPIEYYDVFWKGVREGTVTIPCQDKKQAKALQFDLYGFRRAVRIHDEELSKEFDLVNLTIKINLKEGKGEYSLILTTENKFTDILAGVLGTKEREDIPQEEEEKEEYIPGVTVPLIDASIAEEDTNEQSVYKQYLPGTSEAKEEKD